MKSIIFLTLITFFSMVKELVASSSSSFNSVTNDKSKHDIILIPIEKRHSQKSESNEELSNTETNKIISATLLGNTFDHIHIVFPRKLSGNDNPESHSSEQNDQSEADPQSYCQFLSMSLLIAIYAGLSFEKARNKRRMQNEWENELEFDIRRSVIPHGDDYGSFSTPWTGDLEKYDI